MGSPQVITLTPEEYKRFINLPPQENHAWRFWKEVFAKRKMRLKNTTTEAIEIYPVGTDTFRVTRSDIKLPKKIRAKP